MARRRGAPTHRRGGLAFAALVGLMGLFFGRAAEIQAAPSTDYSYNVDRQTRVVTRPDGQTITYGYDPTGRLATITTPSGVTTYSYDTAGRAQSIATSDGETLTYGYDGKLLTSTTWAGTLSGSVERMYDNDLRLKTITVNGQDPVTYTYDSDGLVTHAGDLVIHRDTQTGLVTDTVLGNVTDSYQYNGFGELVRYTARYNSTVLRGRRSSTTGQATRSRSMRSSGLPFDILLTPDPILIKI